jgi:DNA-binding MarR family transcriptional regulator
MNSQFTERNLVRLIRLVERYTSTSIGRILEQEGYAPLTARHLQVFENIDPLEGSNIVQLAHSAGISKQAMSKLVKDAAAEGYLDVMPNPLDSRFIVVQLTPKGKVFRQNVLDKIVNFYDNLADKQTITPIEIEAMTDTLLKFLRRFEATAEDKIPA